MKRCMKLHKIFMKALTCAGADGILTYFAKQVARWLKEEAQKK